MLSSGGWDAHNNLLFCWIDKESEENKHNKFTSCIWAFKSIKQLLNFKVYAYPAKKWKVTANTNNNVGLLLKNI